MNPYQTSYGLTAEEFAQLEPTVKAYHTFELYPNTCSSLLAKLIEAPASVIWPFVRDFGNPQKFKRFIRSTTVVLGNGEPGSIRDVRLVSGLPASTSTERLEVLDDEGRIFSFRVIGGDHKLHDYRSVTSVNEINNEGKIYAIVLESYIAEIPEGNTADETKMFADTVVKLNLQKLASIALASGNMKGRRPR